MKSIQFILVAAGLGALAPITANAQESAELSALKAKRAALTSELADLDAAITAQVNKEMGRDPIAASSAATEDEDESFLENYVRIRQSVVDDKKIGKPANFSYTIPGDGVDSYLVDVAIDVDLAAFWEIGTQVEFRPYGEYHYNSAVGAESDTLIFGVSPTWASPHDPTEGDFFHVFSGHGAWKRDNTIGGEGFLGNVLWSPTWADLNMGAVKNRSGLLAFRWQPYIGIEGETGNGASTSFKDGERFSFRGGLDGEFFPLPQTFDERLSVTGSLGAWNHVSTSGFFDGYDDLQTYWSVAIDFALDKDNIYRLGAEYRYGDNPATSKFDDDLWVLAFKLLWGK